MWIFYLPIVVWIICLTLRYRALTFLSVNPSFPMSGLFGERKAESLYHLQGMDEQARFELITASTIENRIDTAVRAMQAMALVFPVVLKPDAGQRGSDVAVIRGARELSDYLVRVSGTVLLQEHVEGEEFGVFYMRDPDVEQGYVFSITEKTFPTVIGDGHSNIESLLMKNLRTHYLAAYLLDLHAEKLEFVLKDGEKFKAVEIGSHCRGSVFLDANDLITPDLEAAMNRISGSIPGFFFGRYDIRVPDKLSLKAGQGIKVLEVNGVTSESTNMYDPSYSIFNAYKIMFAQWSMAFKIGKANIKGGAQRITFFGFLKYLISYSSNIKSNNDMTIDKKA